MPGEQRRAVAQQFFDELVAGFHARPAVDRATMFGSAGLRVGARFIAFVGGDGRLIVKVPQAQAAALTAEGVAEPARIGRGAAREWLAVPWEGRDRWHQLLDDAYQHALTLGDRPMTTRQRRR